MSGTRREPTPAEFADEQMLLRPNAVVALRDEVDVPVSVSGNEEIVLARVDGFRPVARIKLKSGLSSEQFRHALRALVRKQLLKLVAMIEETHSELSGLRDATRDSGEGEPAFGQTMPRAASDVIPPHVMAEIEAMIEEEQRLTNADDAGFDEQTDVMSVPKHDDDDDDDG